MWLIKGSPHAKNHGSLNDNKMLWLIGLRQRGGGGGIGRLGVRGDMFAIFFPSASSIRAVFTEVTWLLHRSFDTPQQLL